MFLLTQPTPKNDFSFMLEDTNAPIILTDTKNT